MLRNFFDTIVIPRPYSFSLVYLKEGVNGVGLESNFARHQERYTLEVSG